MQSHCPSKTLLFLLWPLLLGACRSAPKLGAPAGPDAAGIDSVLQDLYAVISGPAGEPRDWDRFRELFAPEARLVARAGATDQDGMRVQVMTPDDYIRQAEPYFAQSGFHESELARRVELFGDLAHVFSTYESRVAPEDELPFQRGINSIQLLRSADGWKVLHLTWESENDRRPLPECYLISPP